MTSAQPLSKETEWPDRGSWALLVAAMGVAASNVTPWSVLFLLLTTAALVVWSAARGGVWRWIIPVGVALAALMSLIGQTGAVGSPRWTRANQKGYAALWNQLDIDARRAAEVVDNLSPPSDEFSGASAQHDAELERIFASLERTSIGSLALIRSAGQVVAWAGPGLPVDPGREGGAFAATLPSHGGALAFVRPASVTLTVSKALDGPWLGWMVTAGRSFASTALPWAAVTSGPEIHSNWSVAQSGSPPEGALVIPGGEWPDLWVNTGPVGGPSSGSSLALLLAAVMLCLALLSELAANDATSDARWGAAMSLALVGMAVVNSFWWVLVAWAGLTLLGMLSRRVFAGHQGSRLWRWILLAALAVAGGWISGGLVDRQTVEVPGFGSVASGTWVLIGLTSLAGWILLREAKNASSQRRPRNKRTQKQRPGGLELLLFPVALVVGAVSLDRPLVVAVIALIMMLWSRRTVLRVPRLAGLLILAGWLVLVWSAAERVAQTHRIHGYRTQLHALSGAEGETLGAVITDSLHDREVLSLTLGQTALGSVEDLAFGLWRSSEINQAGLRSVLAVTSEGQTLSLYESGLRFSDIQAPAQDGSLGSTGGRTSDTTSEMISADPAVAAIHSGRGTLLFAGEYFADLEFAWQPTVSYHLHRSLGVEGGFEDGPMHGPGGWLGNTTTVSARAMDRIAPGMIAVAVGPFEAKGPTWWNNRFSVLSADGTYQLSLAALGPLLALERVAGRVAFCLICAGLLLWIGSRGLAPSRLGQQLRTWQHSYPRRLALTLGALILLPLLLVNLSLLTLHERGLGRERERLEEAALSSARRALDSYVASLPSNFAGITQFDDELFSGVASLVGRDVDLFWDSGVYATSRRNRFASGELSSRLPAPVYRALALRGASEFSFDASSEGGEAAVYAPWKRLTGDSGPRLTLAVPVTSQVAALSDTARVLRSRTLLIGFGILLFGLWATARAARGFSRPILQMIEGTERIAAGAESLGIEIPQEQDLGRLAAAIDRMAGDVSASQKRERVERELVEQILANVTTAITLVRDDGTISRTNPSAESLLSLRAEGRFPEDLAEDLRDLSVFTVQLGDSSVAWAETITINRDGESRVWNLARFPVERHQGGAQLWVVEDVTEVVRGERLAAWAEMARIVAHEIKNPLTPIRLSAEHLREVFREKEDPRAFPLVDRCTSNILEQVEDLRVIADEFSDYSRVPEVEAAWFNAKDWVQEIAASYQPVDSVEADFEPITIQFGSDLDSQLHADQRQLTRMLRNLIENALRVAQGQPVEIRLNESVDNFLVMEVADRGPGVPEGDLDRIFEPYFSTHATGTGLGLPISRRIVQAHGGSIEAHRRQGGGLRVRVQIPRQRAI